MTHAARAWRHDLHVNHCKHCMTDPENQGLLGEARQDYLRLTSNGQHERNFP